MVKSNEHRSDHTPKQQAIIQKEIESYKDMALDMTCATIEANKCNCAICITESLVASMGAIIALAAAQILKTDGKDKTLIELSKAVMNIYIEITISTVRRGTVEINIRRNLYLTSLNQLSQPLLRLESMFAYRAEG